MYGNSVLTPFSDADLNHDNVVSVYEAYLWEKKYQSKGGSWVPNPEHPLYQDTVSNLGAKTSLNYPNLVSSINDLLIDTANIGIYGITTSITLSGSESLIFGPSTKIYLLNNAKIYIRGGGTLALQDSVEIYGNEQNSVTIENGSLDLGLNVSFNNRDTNHLFDGLHLSGYTTPTQINHARFHNSYLWNESLSLSLHYTSFEFPPSEEIIYGIYSMAGDVTILQSTFTNTSVNLINPGKHSYWQANIQHCTFHGGSVNLESYKNFKVDYNLVEHPYDYAIIAHNAGNGSSGNQSISQNNIYNSIIGIFLNNSYAKIFCNNIHDNERGVYIGNSSNISMTGCLSLTQKVKNCFNEEIYAENECFPYPFLYNEIVHESNAVGNQHPLVRYINSTNDSVSINVQNNCWASNFDSVADLIGTNVTFNSEPQWCPGNPTPWEPPIDLYANAISLYDTGNYVEAKSIFKTIVGLFPKSVQAQASMK